MSSKKDHIAVAEKNQITVDYLLEKNSDHLEWIATVAFYKAVHLVEALFAKDNGHHSSGHVERETRLKKTNRYKKIYKSYRPLLSASLIARYLADRDGNAYKTFSDYMNIEDIRSEILGHRLTKVEASVNNLLK